MAYFLVMGGLVLSAAFTLGWALWRCVRLVVSRLPGRRGKATRKRAAVKRGARGQGRPAPRKPAKQASGARASAKGRASARGVAGSADKAPREPGRLSRWLARWRAALPLAVVASLIYLVARLAEFGLAFRPPHDAPSGFHALVTALGWFAAALLAAALCNRLALWRCR